MVVVAAETLDYVTLLTEVVALLVTAGGLAFVVRSLRQTAEQQRVESGPYIRVDLGSLDLPMHDFSAPDAAYRNRSQMSDLRATKRTAS